MSLPRDNSHQPADSSGKARPRHLQGELWEDPVEVSARTIDHRSYIYVDEINERISRRRIENARDDGQIDFALFKMHEADYIEEAIRREDAQRSSKAVSQAVRDASELMKQNPGVSSAEIRDMLRQRVRNFRAHARLTVVSEVDMEENRESRALSLLKGFRYFCDRDSRDIVDLVLADLSRDVRQLTSDGRSRGFIRAVVWRHVGGTVISITWNAFNSLLKRLATTLGLIKQISK